MRVQGDMNGLGEFLLTVGEQEVARVRAAPGEQSEAKRFSWTGLDRDELLVSADGMPVRGTAAVNMSITRGEEGRVAVMIRNSTWADVSLRDRFTDAPPR